METVQPHCNLTAQGFIYFYTWYTVHLLHFTTGSRRLPVLLSLRSQCHKSS